MTQEEKDLLLKDLYARLPYGIIVHDNLHNIDLRIDWINSLNNIITGSRVSVPIEEVCPYLRSMSSMIDEEREEYRKFSYYGAAGVRPYSHYDFVAVPSFEKMDWLHEHHFDYRGLIERGLALEAPEGMYNTKTTCDNCEDKNYCSQSEYVKNNCYKWNNLI